MIELLQLILNIVASLFKSRAKLEAEILVLRIDCRDAVRMIGQKGPPALGWWAAIHVPRDRRLSEREAELEQFTMNAWRTPEVICAAHLANELA